jgi:hypothetical protein
VAQIDALLGKLGEEFRPIAATMADADDDADFVPGTWSIPGRSGTRGRQFESARRPDRPLACRAE